MQPGSVTRKLAAILMADVVGYSRMVGADEVGTLERLKELRSRVVNPALTRHRGRLVRTLGDGLLIDFSSAVDAVSFAVAIQVALLDRNHGVPPDKQIVLRIGINVGDIVVEDDNILGDGVNVAARLETSCEPGGVLISRAVRDQIRDKLQLPFADLGEREVKNIARPVRVFGLGPDQIAALASQGDQASPEPVTTIAALAPSAAPFSIVVLPFNNLSGEREQEYFADGLTDSLTAELATMMPELSVVASTSAFTYKGKPTDVRQIGRDLDVRFVLAGSVLPGPGTVRINAQLVNAVSGAHLWAERFEGDGSDLVRLQDRLALQIAKTVGARFVAEAARDAERRDGNPLARDLYLRASAVWQHVPVLLPHLQEAEGLLRQALALDDTRPELYGTLAISIVVQIYDWSHQLQLTPDQEQARLAEAEAFIDRALALDFSHPNAHYARGLLLGRGGGRWREAAQALEMAVNLRPNSAGFKLGYAQALGHLGEPERGSQ